MIKCYNCHKEYKKNGLSRHLSYCLKKNILNKNYFNKISDDIMHMIYSYISHVNDINNIDKFITISSYYKEIFYISCTCKRFYYLFNFNENLKISIEKSIKEQNNKNICKTTAKSIYPIKDTELENMIPYKLAKNPHYRNAFSMKIYREIDILNFLRIKYGSYYEYLKLVSKKELEKKKHNDKKDILEAKRKIKYDALFEKYELNDKYLYEKYYNYIVNVKPSFAVIEEEIIKKYEYNLRFSKVEKYILENNLQKMKSKILDKYIENNEYNFEYAMIDIENKNKRNIELCNMLIDNNLLYENLDKDEKNIANNYIYDNISSIDKTMQKIKDIIVRRYNIDNIIDKNIKEYINHIEYSEILKYIKNGIPEIKNIYIIISNAQERIKRKNDINIELRNKNIHDLNNNETKMIDDYINDNKMSIEDIINIINNKKNRKNDLIYRLNEVGLYLRDDSEICRKYIENGEMHIDEVVNIMEEMNFYYTYTDYSIFYENHRYNNSYYDDYMGRCYNKNSIELSYNAKNDAIKSYIKKFKTYEDALLDNCIPSSLHKVIKKLFENNIKCKCNNIPSPVCGYCVKCCLGCNKHIKNNYIII